MKLIPLFNRSKLVGHTQVDDEDFDKFGRFRWGLYRVGYVRRGSGHPNKKTIYLHRELMDNKPGVVDHINGDKLDNRKCNLRVCSQKQNVRHRTRCNPFSKTNILGVYPSKCGKKYLAAIMVDGENKHLGTFQTVEEAKAARIEAEKKYFGSFAPDRSLF